MGWGVVPWGTGAADWLDPQLRANRPDPAAGPVTSATAWVARMTLR